MSTVPVRTIPSWFALAALLAIAACNASPAVEEAAAPMASTAGALQFENLRRTVATLEGKFNGLAEAMPEGAYSWAPMDGVRSVGDVFQHVAADNFFVPSLMGVAAPASTGITTDVETFRAYQSRSMTRDEVRAIVAESFTFLLGAMDATSGELDRAMTLGTSETTIGDVWIRAVVHLHEHLGQSIAYARSNDVVPPWSN